MTSFVLIQEYVIFEKHYSRLQGARYNKVVLLAWYRNSICEIK